MDENLIKLFNKLHWQDTFSNLGMCPRSTRPCPSVRGVKLSQNTDSVFQILSFGSIGPLPSPLVPYAMGDILQVGS
jgi:hypothetical protein